jgi:hypothetical protein
MVENVKAIVPAYQHMLEARFFARPENEVLMVIEVESF